ncbi:MAG: toprim domain-containing protein, partial [Herbaspirillum sp.]
ETPLFQKGSELYGLFEARQAIRAAGYVLVTEGYMDVVALAQLGFPQVVATLGTACTATHAQKLLRQTDHVVFSFDGDRAGRGAARRALDACLPYAADDKMISFLFLPAEHDPDSYIRTLGADAFQQEVMNAMPLSQFLLNQMVGDNDLTTAEGRARVQFDAKPLLQLLPPMALRAQIVRDLARLTQSSAAEVEALCELKLTVQRARSAPARSARPAPVGLERQIMRLLIAHPELNSGLDDATLNAIGYQITDDTMLSQLVKVVRPLDGKISFAALAEYLQQENADFDGLVAEIAAMAISDVEIAKLELRGVLRQLEMEKLTAEMNRLAGSDMKLEEIRNRYQQLMLRQEVLRRDFGAGMELS